MFFQEYALLTAETAQSTYSKSLRFILIGAILYNMRIDKFLKVSRIIKRRTVAQEACDAGKVYVNGRSVKPAYVLKVGDRVELRLGAPIVFIVKSLNEKASKEESQTLYEIQNQ